MPLYNQLLCLPFARVVTINEKGRLFNNVLFYCVRKHLFELSTLQHQLLEQSVAAISLYKA
jgi:hypothetical protein